VTVSQKAALSLLISVFLFAGIAVLAYTGLFDLIETRFYNPSITRSLTRETNRSAEVVQTYISDLQTRFTNSLNSPAVRRSFLPNQSVDDIFERSRIYGMLMEQVGGLQSVRFVDYNGVRIHFSTYAQDIISQDRLSIAYRNYADDPRNEPFRNVQVAAQEKEKLFLDSAQDRIIFSYPFYDSMDVYRGTALLTLSVRAVTDELINEGRIKVGEDVSVVSTPQGILTGSPNASRAEILDRVADIWNDGLLSLTPFDSADSEHSLAVISAKIGQTIFYGQIVNEEIFSFPQPMKVILLVSIFLTIYLTIFFFFNLRQDTMTVVQNRLKGLQISLIEQFYDRKGDMDWTHWTRELEQRREEIRAEVKQGIRVGQGRRSEENVDALIDKSWDELLAVIGARRKTETNIDEEKLQTILNKILQTLPAAGAMVPAVQPKQSAPSANVSPQEFSVVPAGEAPAETAAEEAELETLEELDAEELAPAETVEETGEAEELAELEELEELEELDETEVVDSLDTAEEAGEISVPRGFAELTPQGEDPAEGRKPGGLLATASQKQDEEPSAAMESAESIDDLADSIEELEELEELEEVETPDVFDSSEAAPAGAPAAPQQEIADLASEIEFNSSIAVDDAEETENLINTELEIVSPFASMLSSLDDVKIEDVEETPSVEETAEAAEPEKKESAPKKKRVKKKSQKKSEDSDPDGREPVSI
jgi:hypothetical protein